MKVIYNDEEYYLKSTFYKEKDFVELRREFHEVIVTIIAVQPPHIPKNVFMSQLKVEGE